MNLKKLTKAMLDAALKLATEDLVERMRVAQEKNDKLERENAELRGKVQAFEFVERLRVSSPIPSISFPIVKPLTTGDPPPHVPGTTIVPLPHPQPLYPNIGPPAYPGYPHVTCGGGIPTNVVMAKTTLDATACAGLGPTGLQHVTMAKTGLGPDGYWYPGLVPNGTLS